MASIRLSIIVPARDAENTLGRCLKALQAEIGPESEILVVDDGSIDRTGEIARAFGLEPIRLAHSEAPAAARNLGARAARGPVLLFIDADTEACPGFLSRALTPIESGEVDALIGSYDDEPSDPSTVSRFKNLAHYHFHQESAGPIASFWGACGVIRRDLFFAVGGFDADKFRKASIEDVELGWRLNERGSRIRLDPELRVRHLKRWTLTSLIVTDVFCRAVPWTRLCLERGKFPRTLNLSLRQRIAALVALPLVLLPASPWLGQPLASIAVAAFPLAIGLNFRLFRLFLNRGGPRLAFAGFFLQQLYYLYSWVGLGLGTVIYLFNRTPSQEKGPQKESDCT